ncbi:LLM class F420-dependent oxidoreductase [Pseudonocardia sp.]|uniref:LLM class F420-dependent oxidoreductase n=1 Tax=Pseudonocardia sp. TaxID=60912 RepID=UPI00261B335D|nr:LLM class F420-dependent oxidoreductase [Pseudonocardia sp.]
MDFRIFTEPQQGASYQDLLRVARCAEDSGYDAFFRSDHYLKMGKVSGEPGPTDAWLTLAGLAVQTSTIRLGTLMSPATFRLPGPLAISVAQVDQMSGGRVELGIGSGWYADEHTAYGIPFPPLGERFDRYAEQVEIISGLWATLPGDRYEFAGRHYTLTGCPALPKPVQQPHPPLLIGGMGARRTPALAARYADEFNVPFAGIDAAAEQFDRVAAACREIGRDAAEIRRSAALTVGVARDDNGIAARALAAGRSVDDLRANGLAGTPAEAVDRLGRWRERTGISRIYLQLLDLGDLDQIELIAAEVMPQLN